VPESHNPLVVLDRGTFYIDEMGEIGGIGEIVSIASAGNGVMDSMAYEWKITCVSMAT